MKKFLKFTLIVSIISGIGYGIYKLANEIKSELDFEEDYDLMDDFDDEDCDYDANN